MKEASKCAVKSPIFWAKLAGYLVPVAFLGYILYINILPFGFEKTYTLIVGAEGDTKISDFYLEPSPGLSERKIAEDGSTYRELNGTAHVIFTPGLLPKDTLAEVTVQGNGAALIPIQLNLDHSTVEWNYNWDFTKGLPKELINKDVFSFDKSAIFNGKASLELPSSTNAFEDKALSVYADWLPTNAEKNSQELIGHFNWEIYQNMDSVSFRIGRVDQKDGPFYVVTYKILNPETFFGNRHTLLARYVPDPTNGQGYLELYVDKQFADRVYFGKSVIWKEYNDTKNLTLGKSSHASASFFSGILYQASITENAILNDQTKIIFYPETGKDITLSVFSKATSTLKAIELHATRK